MKEFGKPIRGPPIPVFAVSFFVEWGAEWSEINPSEFRTSMPQAWIETVIGKLERL